MRVSKLVIRHLLVLGRDRSLNTRKNPFRNEGVYILRGLLLKNAEKRSSAMKDLKLPLVALKHEELSHEMGHKEMCLSFDINTDTDH